MLEMPVLETTRLLIRPFVLEDLQDAYRLFDVELADANLGTDKMATLAERAEWLQWSVLNHRQLAILYQPPYGDRAIILKSSGALIGSVGYVPCLAPFEQLPGLACGPVTDKAGYSIPEFGLFYAIALAQRRRGYASEAARAMLDYAFQRLRLKRVVATTTSDNPGSMGVMLRLGMRVEKNPLPEPAWLQVVGVVENSFY